MIGRGKFKRRGVSQVIGSLLIFAVVILLLGVIQATLVPENVADREFEHSKEVEGDLNRLAATVAQVRAGSGRSSVSVSVSPRYGSTSALLLYPTEPTGQFRTGSPSNVQIGNIRAVDDESRDYWEFSSGSPVEYNTRTLQYNVNYNRFRGAPKYTLNQGILAKQFESSGNIIIATDQSPIQGRRIILTLLKGGIGVSSDTERSVSVNPGSVGRTFTTVESQGGPIELTLPTDLDESKWCEIMSSEIRGGSPADTSCSTVSGTSDGNIVDIGVSSGELRLELRETDMSGEKITYLIDVSTVSLEQRASDPGPKYIIESEDVDRQIAVGTEGTLGARVLDKYGNPVSGVNVEFLVNGSSDSSFNPVGTATTGAEGYARTPFTSSTTGTQQVKAQFNSGGSDEKEAIYTINSQDPSSGGDAGLLDNGQSAGVVLTDATLNSGEIDVEFENIGNTSKEINEAQVSFYYKTNSNSEPDSLTPTWDDGSSSDLEVGGDFKIVNEQINSGDTETYSFDPQGNPQQGDFFVINIKYSSGQSESYFVIATN